MLEELDQQTDQQPLSDLQQLHELVGQLHVLENNIKDKEAELEALKEVRKTLATISIPDLMDELDIKSITTHDGVEIAIKAKWVGNIKQALAPQALSWIRQNGYGGIIKHELHINGKAGDDDNIQALKDHLEETATPYEDKEFVHPQTLGAWIRELKENGEPIDDTLFGVHQLREAKTTTKE